MNTAEQRAHAFKIACQLTKNMFDADDVTQDAMLRVLSDERPPHVPIGAFVYIRVRNAAGALRDKRTRMASDWRVECDVYEAYDVEGPDAPASQVEARLGLERVQNAVRRMPVALQRTFELRFLEDRTDGECAELLGVTNAGVRARCALIRQYLNGETPMPKRTTNVGRHKPKACEVTL